MSGYIGTLFLAVTKTVFSELSDQALGENTWARKLCESIHTPMDPSLKVKGEQPNIPTPYADDIANIERRQVIYKDYPDAPELVY